MANFFKKSSISLWKKIAGHKVLSVFLAIVIIWGGYYGYGKIRGSTAESSYVLVAVEKGTLVSSVSGSGQVSSSNQVDVKSKGSGDVIGVSASDGQVMKKGALIAQIDSQDAQKTVRDAQANLDAAKISLQKLKQPADALSLIQAENALTQAQQSKQNAADDLLKVYDGGFNSVANAFIDLPGVMTGLDSIINGATVNGNQNNSDAYYSIIQNYVTNASQFSDMAVSSYQTARTAYDKNFQDYKNTSRYTDQTTMDALISETYETTKSIAEATKNTKNLLDAVNDVLITKVKGARAPAIFSTHQANVQSYTATTNSHLQDLLSVENSIKSDHDAITNGDLTIKEKTESLAKLKAGADTLDIQSQELVLTQRNNALLDAQENLSNYYIRAPFDGVTAKVGVKNGDSVSSGAAVATFITKQKLAEVTLNEVDVAKVKVGQKATITFDAISDLSITGEVAGVDTIGTITQGVVNYTIKISFDTQDDRVKPGMSASAAIITDTKQDVLLVPNSAVKSQGSASYVEVLDQFKTVTQGSSSQASLLSSKGVASKVAPVRKSVEVGSSNDSMTEVINGLQEGDLIVARTITGGTTATTPTQSQNSSFRIPGLGGVGGRGG